LPRVGAAVPCGAAPLRACRVRCSQGAAPRRAPIARAKDEEAGALQQSHSTRRPKRISLARRRALSAGDALTGMLERVIRSMNAAPAPLLPPVCLRRPVKDAASAAHRAAAAASGAPRRLIAALPPTTLAVLRCGTASWAGMARHASRHGWCLKADLAAAGQADP